MCARAFSYCGRKADCHPSKDLILYVGAAAFA